MDLNLETDGLGGVLITPHMLELKHCFNGWMN